MSRLLPIPCSRAVVPPILLEGYHQTFGTVPPKEVVQTGGGDTTALDEVEMILFKKFKRVYDPPSGRLPPPWVARDQIAAGQRWGCCGASRVGEEFMQAVPAAQPIQRCDLPPVVVPAAM